MVQGPLLRWDSFIEAADLEVFSLMHDDSVFILSENLGRIAKMSCPPELDKALRDTPKILTQLVFRMPSMGSKPKAGRWNSSWSLARMLGRGSPNAGTLVCQGFHCFMSVHLVPLLLIVWQG